MTTVKSNVWSASEAEIRLRTTGSITVTTAAALESFFPTTGTAAASSIVAVLKNISVTEPMGDVDKVDLMGKDSSGYQHAKKERKPSSMVEITGTAILPGKSNVEKFLYGTAETVTGGYKRYRSGKAVANEVDFLLYLTDGTDVVSYAGTNMDFTAKDIKVTGADGHFECDFTIKGLPSNWYGPEFKE
jgi:hypothetical protein